MPNNRPIKEKILPTRLLNQLLILLLFNDLTNIHLLLQQQQNQIKALSKAAMQQQEVKKKSFLTVVFICVKSKS